MEPKLAGEFVLGIHLLKDEQGRESVEMKIRNKNIRDEIIIMKMEIVLKRMKDDYFNNHNRSVTSVSGL